MIVSVSRNGEKHLGETCTIHVHDCTYCGLLSTLRNEAPTMVYGLWHAENGTFPDDRLTMKLCFAAIEAFRRKT